MKLLTPAHANAKTAKNQQFDQYLTFILHLAPSTLSGYNLCPKASAGCAAACLNTAGRGVFNSVQTARINKSRRFVEQRDKFMGQLIKDLNAVVAKAKREKKTPVVRLNGTSDIAWERIKVNGLNMFEMFPQIIFYDYTKILSRIHTIKPYMNYFLVFSRSETNWHEAIEALKAGVNVAAVFSGPLPEVFDGFPVINGDNHDLRFLDYLEGHRGVIVGLKAKGKAKRDTSGFTIQLTNAVKAA